MRALFAQMCPQLQDGSYVLVAKTTTPDTSFEQLQKDFTKVLKKTGALLDD